MAKTSHVLDIPAPRAVGARRGGDLPRVRYLAEVAARGYVHIAHDQFPGALRAAAVTRLGEPVLVRASADGEELEAFLRLEGGLVALLDLDWGEVKVEVAAQSHGRAAKAVKRLRRRLARPAPASSSVPFAFWSSHNGGQVRHRDLRVPSWGDVRRNYAPVTAARLDRLMSLSAPAGGRLLVWHGVPGTGKTHALRALAGAWRNWCALHYVLDPETLLGGDPSYLLDLLTWDDDASGERWRLVVLEDAGQLVRDEAHGSAALASLLNLTDGLLGQGTRTLVLITTNEPVEFLHPAARRPGRCLCEVGFEPLPTAEARRWLDRAGTSADVTGPTTLSQLYALTSDGDAHRLEAPRRPAVGFARALQ
jgi:hypothetical protein